MQRLYTLDYLRGATAFFIMIYHYCSWMSIGNSPDSFLGKIGIYGVSIFYILSGLTLYYVYQHNFTLSACCIKSFFSEEGFSNISVIMACIYINYFTFQRASNSGDSNT